MEPNVSFPENWSPPPELARALPREVRRSGRGTFLVVMALVFLIAAIPLVLVVRNAAAQESARAESLRKEGREATGEIVRLWNTGKSSTPMVTYAFTAGGRRFRGESSVPGRFWDGLQRAGFLPIQFLPADPNINHPLAWQEDLPPAWLPFALPAILMGCALALLASHRREAALAAVGLATAGVVTRCHRVKGGWSARYWFRTREGAIMKGSSLTKRAQEIGATVCILYLPENPRRNQIYPLRFYKVER